MSVLAIGPRILAAPVIHGSGECALQVRRLMLTQSFDCIAVPLPPSFQQGVEAAIERLPAPSMIAQPDRPRYRTLWTPDAAEAENDDDRREFSYAPIDPCQPVIAALRVALGEHIDRAFIDLETSRFVPYSQLLPDPFALKKVSLERFAAALLPSIPRPPEGQPRDRVRHMAARLRELEQRYSSILLVCSVLDWPWIREAYQEQTPVDAEDDLVEPVERHCIDPKTLIFLLGELPFITGLYEQARAELEDDENLSIDGVKQLLMAARAGYQQELRGRARKITPHLLRQCLKYVRNLTLLDRRLTPDLYTLVIAAKQLAGDRYALQTAETAREYPYPGDAEERVSLGIDQARLPDGEMVDLVNRLPGTPVEWRSCELRPRPEKSTAEKWQMRWNPFAQCSWPPEDELIENFRAHVFDRARTIMNMDLARTEKFTTSLQDGIDVRETLRHWYDGQLYVKVLPPDKGHLDAVVMLFEAPLDPRDYPWRTTWFAEHQEESTLAMCATDYRQEMVGPGIGLATYGGALFLYPPVSIPDIWQNPELNFTETLEERLLAAACLHSRSRQIALLSPAPPGAGWRRLARHYGKSWVHVPLSQFSESTLQQLRMVHVLNGKQVRSYAADFIRKA
ncbi:hypothetical protein [Lignipirellula cremea]|uniref:Uncharacterized protein n=1 Tax=Lignipirellula cremea TaxID=2528010 RepID=A0A518DS16_9BACT|nr:hypothetical protein [Lignipirellula cremea]QDU94627.1 hypothetical protein Pla8534_24200 [Lignipirellula cremea]